MISLVQAFKGDTVTVGIPRSGDTRTVEVMPKGVDLGQTIRLRGLGGNTVKGASRDLSFPTKDYMGYRREGFDSKRLDSFI